MKVLHWFRNDLRYHDNPALYDAVEQSQGNVICCFLASEQQWNSHDWGRRKINYLYRSLAALEDSLKKKKIPLVTLACDTFEQAPEAIVALAEANQCDAVSVNGEYAINEKRRDAATQSLLERHGIRWIYHHDQSIRPVKTVLTQQETPYSVYTPFKKRWLATQSESDLIPLAAVSQGTSVTPQLPENGIAANKVDIKGRIDETSCDLEHFPAGETAAHQQLEDFVAERIGQYKKQRDIPALNGTSKLSPFLALGVLSGRQCYFTALQAQQETGADEEEGINSWLNELIWRDFYIHILDHHPSLAMHRAFKTETEALTWKTDAEQLNAWKQGQTGFPLVDAAMRQLNETGWMHNRLRMVVAMFLSKNMFHDWRLGEQYFMQNLVDGYLPANNGGWQWSASTGTDAAPYFRIYNPITQGERFDPDGNFIRKWVPELERLDIKSVHNPSSGARKQCDYPPPILDLKSTRQEAIERFKALKQ